ncbi:hypothetical protein HYN59_00745 [Flavobacterium album]|uniref:Toxin-antitoxin system YwqK family antitoxin n=1 Tax=Flavobacterium album TaxID=2175091 RepID=A0A2S1QTZ4_9FLAO|nr:toxin-antitoxin system YwqK family antitoxin [Flavobacterium album]AWH83731.1 hypothetical protein HYN59_00745 [Flavobacterium album]
MKNIIALLVLALSLSANAQQKKYFDKDWKETTQASASYYRISKKENGLYLIKDYFIDGHPQFSGYSSIENDPLNLQGKATWYYDNGAVEREGFYKENNPDGKVTSYYPNGSKMDETEYANGKRNGYFKSYFPTGEIYFEAFFADDKYEGKYVIYESPSVKKEEYHFKNNVPDGPYEEYNNGKLFAKGNASRGFQDGVCIENFYRNEDKLRRKYTVVNKLLDGTYTEYNLDGTVASTGEFKNGRAVSFEGKSLGVVNGSLVSSKMELKKGIENWKIYRDGKLILEAFYDEGFKTGLWKVYTFDGSRLYQTRDYTNANCFVQYLQGAKENHTTSLPLEKRFMGDADMIRDHECDSIIIKDMVKRSEDENDDLHPFYHQKPYERPAKKGTADESTYLRPGRLKDNIDYKEPARAKDFLSKNNCTDNFDEKFPDVTKCERKFDGTTFKVFTSNDKDTLTKLKGQLKPAENEVLFFYQTFEERLYKKGETAERRYMGFSTTETIKVAVRNQIIKPWYIIKILEHEFFTIEDFSGSDAHSVLVKEIGE